MKTGHRTIQLHTYGQQPSTCLNLYVSMPSTSVLSVPAMCLPSGAYVSACAKCVYCRECEAGRRGMLCIMLGPRQLPHRLPAVCPPVLSAAHVTQTITQTVAT